VRSPGEKFWRATQERSPGEQSRRGILKRKPGEEARRGIQEAGEESRRGSQERRPGEDSRSFRTKSVHFSLVLQRKRDFKRKSFTLKKKLLWLQRGGGGTSRLECGAHFLSQNARHCSHSHFFRGRGGRAQAANLHQPLFRQNP